MPRLAPVLTLVLALVLARVALADPAPVPMPAVPVPDPAAAAPIDAPLVFPAPRSRHRRPRTVPVGVRAARFARHLLGVRYTYGGTSPATGFDCSGFVRYVWNRFGVHLPRASYAQFDAGRRVGRRGLRPGDLVFFDDAGHVGLYLGDGRFIHAPHTGTVVSIAALSGPYGAGYDGARGVR